MSSVLQLPGCFGAIAKLSGKRPSPLWTALVTNFEINLERLARELSDVFSGKITSAASILPIRHPQLDGVNSNLIKTNRKALALIISSYDEMIVRKNEVREALSNGVELRPRLVEAVDATIKRGSARFTFGTIMEGQPLLRHARREAGMSATG